MFNRRYRQCFCMNNKYNNFNNNSGENLNDIIEDSCEDSCSCDMNNMMNSCECGFDEEYDVFPENPMLAQSYVPIQYMKNTFKPGVGLKMGTIFPELVSPYMPGQSIDEIEYIRAANTIGEGCNK